MDNDDGIDIRKVARAISLVENDRPGAQALLKLAYGQIGSRPVVGIAGPPGAGKSTLVDRLAVHWADAGEKVAVVAIDPASPFTGGAVLGDRVRMNHASEHPRIYLRSLSSRGAAGGLSRAATDVVVAMGAMGFDRILVETVGSGQNDVDVADLADCVIVVSVPGLGDQMQAAKAGILEIGDVYAVNKSDLPGADTVIGHLSANLDLVYPGNPGRNVPTSTHGPCAGNAELAGRHGSAEEGFWRPPVVKLSASKATGIESLAAAVDGFLIWQNDSGRHGARITERIVEQIRRLATRRLMTLCDQGAEAGGGFARLAETVTSGHATPEEVASQLVNAILGNAIDDSDQFGKTSKSTALIW
jgi:LAO/AO transport system kinase